MRYYNRIISGKQKIETMAQLKEFWLFAYAQGKNYRNMREYIAQLVRSAPLSYELRGIISFDPATQDTNNAWENFVSMSVAPDRGQSAEEYSDAWWHNINTNIQRIDPNPLDERITKIYKKNHLPHDKAMEVAQKIVERLRKR